MYMFNEKQLNIWYLVLPTHTVKWISSHTKWAMIEKLPLYITSENSHPSMFDSVLVDHLKCPPAQTTGYGTSQPNVSNG